MSERRAMRWLSAIGFATRTKLADWGHATRLFIRLFALSGPTLRRFGLVRDQIFFLGNHSLAIITVSGLFVGFVLGLRAFLAAGEKAVPGASVPTELRQILGCIAA